MVKELFQNSTLRQTFSKTSNGSKIRNLLFKTNSQKPLKRKTIYQSIFPLTITQILKILEKQAFQRINDWHCGTSSTRKFVQGFCFFFQQFPVYQLINLFQKLIAAASFPACIKNTIQNRKLRFWSANHCLNPLSYCFIKIQGLFDYFTMRNFCRLNQRFFKFNITKKNIKIFRK